jgi:nucleotide-binding universal stress UspA family protein/hemerythrin-like domain-containing protein
MYRHLLVPIDGTDLSVGAIGSAVELACSLQARITFFHVVPDHASSPSGEADMVRLPVQVDYPYTGRARELLAKAEAAARALGVPCDSAHVVGARPATAIVAAARARRCDLIFMAASHGHGSKLGMALASEMLTALMNADIPVLMSSTGDPPPAAHAIGIIRDEHRSLAAVMHAWMLALAGARTAGAPPDARLMRAVLSYIQDFSVALHHPKEEQHLFRRLRERSRSIGVELDELERQHARDVALVAELARRVDALADAGPDAVAQAGQLEEAVQAYAAFLWEHMGREEGAILPAAQRHLSAADWAEIDAAFEQNHDPNFAGETDQEFRQLFSRIVNAAEQFVDHA